MSGIHPFRVLRAKPLWIANGVITGVLALLFTVFYVGANIDPVDHMKNLPVGLVNADKGAAVGGKQVNLGRRITESITKSTASGDKIDWKVMDEKEMKKELGKGKLYGALVVPADFTSATTALTGAATTGAPVRPTLTVLTNQSAGSVGSSLARTATTQAAESASLQVGKELTSQVGTGQAKLPAAARVLLADPAAVTVEDGHPLDSHSGLGLTAFYYALVLVVCGMLSANVISGQVDHALGYTHNDMGPLRLHRPLIRATRVQTLAISSTLMAGLSLLMGTLVMAGAVGLMGMHAAHLPLLWLLLGVRHRGLRDRCARPCSPSSARPACWWSRWSSSGWRCRRPTPPRRFRRCPASTASWRSSNRCGRSPAASARSSTTTPRPTPA